MLPAYAEQLRAVTADHDGAPRKTKALNADLVNNVNQKQVADICFGLLNYLQNRKDFRDTAEAVVAVAALFKLMFETFGVQPTDAMQVAANVVSDADGRYIPEFKAISMYIEKEIMP